jgi:hypothetical protein
MPLSAMVCMTAAVLPAQQKFPMQSGEWTATLSVAAPNGKPTVLLYCLTDETWDRALIHNPSCSTQNLTITSSGASFVTDCQHGTVASKAAVSITFDGKQHMVTKDSVDTTINGQTTNKSYSADYRWKGPSCDPNADMNLKFKQH